MTQQIWRYAFTQRLGIDKEAFARTHVVVVIPDAFGRDEVREIMRFLMDDMRVGAVMFVQESLGCAFGAGVPTACVIDIGALTTTVACVEDGLVLPQTCISMNYGSEHISRALLRLLTRPGRAFVFPFPQISLNNPQHMSILNDMKETLCDYTQDSETIQTYYFTERQRMRKPQLYRMNVSNEPILAGMVRTVIMSVLIFTGTILSKVVYV